jgi:hypothetical protein
MNMKNARMSTKTNIDPKTKAMHHAHMFESFKCMKLVHIIGAPNESSLGLGYTCFAS